MINFVALSLVFTSLVTAGVWSPTPAQEKLQIKQDVIVKEGHRTVEIEYQQDDGNTKVTISPQEGQAHVVDSSTMKGKISDTMENVKEKLEEENGHKMTPRELVCDAFGKCKHKIASAVGKTKEMVSEKAREAADKVQEVEEEAKQKVGETLERVKDTVSPKAREAADMAGEAKETVKEIVGQKPVQGIKDAIDIGKTLKGDVERNVSKLADAAKRKVTEKVEEVEEKVEHKKKDLKEILRRGKDFVCDIFGYVLSPELRASGVGTMQLLSLSVAYGMSIWVTFISSYIMAGLLPRQQFAVLQSKIYPVYFRSMAYSVGVLLLGHFLSPRKCKAEIFQGFNLFASLLMLLFNLRYLEPRATKVMFERIKLEKEEGRGMDSRTAEPSSRVVDSITEPSGTGVSRSATTPTTTRVPSSSTPQEKPEDAAAKSEMIRLSETLKRLNSYSSFLNIFTLMALTWHLVHLGQKVHTDTQC